MSVHLGRHAPKRLYDQIRIKAANYNLPPAPARVAWGTGIRFGMFLNDRMPCCTCSAYAHLQQMHSRRTGIQQVPDDADVRELFHRTGWETGLSNNDGRGMEDVLSSLRRVGFHQSPGDPDAPAGSFETILGYAAVDPTNQAEVRSALWLFGGVYAGLWLPLSAQQQYQRVKPWTFLEDAAEADRGPGGWGGHAVTLCSANTTGPVCATWGGRKQMSWRFWREYCDEAYVVLTPDWARTDAPAPSGFLRERLLADLAAI